MDWKTTNDLAFRFNLSVLAGEISKVGEPLNETYCFNRPTLFISGENSNYIVQDDSVLIESHFSDFEIIEIENSGHWVHAEKPKEFFEVVSRYLIY